MANSGTTTTALTCLQCTKVIQHVELPVPGDRAVKGNKDSFVVLTKSLRKKKNNKLVATDISIGNSNPPSDRQEAIPTRVNNSNLSYRLLLHEELLKFTDPSISSDHDTHCLCGHCVEYINKLLDVEQNDAIKLKQHANEFIQLCNNNNRLDYKEVTLGSIKNIIDEYVGLTDSFSDLENEEKALNKQLRSLQIEEQQLIKQEKQFYDDKIEWSKQLYDFTQQRDHHMTRIRSSQYILSSLYNVNTFNDSFYISHDKTCLYGTINGFRLGKLKQDAAAAMPSVSNVDWDEINIAFGHVALLIDKIATVSNIVFDRYKVLPNGSYSTIVDKYKQKSHKLFYLDDKSNTTLIAETGKRMLKRISFDTFEAQDNLQSFNCAMIALLECMKDITTIALRDDFGKQLKLYSIQVGSNNNNTSRGLFRNMSNSDIGFIGGHSLKLHYKDVDSGNNDWTTALTFVLSNLKWLLVWSENNIKKEQV